ARHAHAGGAHRDPSRWRPFQSSCDQLLCGIPPKYSRKVLSPGREGVFRSLYRSCLEEFLSRTGHDHSRRAQGEILAKGQADFSPVVQRAERPGPIDERVHAMTHENLWAPWRMAYILASKDAPKDEGCFLCKGLADARDRE